MNKNSLRKTNFDPTEYADLLFGVGSATSAGPSLPCGSIHPSPETLEKDCGGYYRDQPIIGFDQAFVSGSGGVKCYGNFLLAPCVDKVELDHTKRAAFAVAGSEIAHCYEYSVLLENGIGARLTPAHNSAIYTFEYPKGKKASLIIDVAHKLDIDAAMRYGSVTIDAKAGRVWGGGRFFGNWSGFEWDMFFALEFDTDAEEIGFFEDDELQPLDKDTSATHTIDTEKRFGAYAVFHDAPASSPPCRPRSFLYLVIIKARDLLVKKGTSLLGTHKGYGKLDLY